MGSLRRLFGISAMVLAGLSASTAAVGLEAVWVFGGEPLGTGALEVEMPATGAYPGDQLVPLVCHIRAQRAYERVDARFALRSEDGGVVAQGAQAFELAMGLNESIFHLDGSGLAPGRYRAEITVQYARNQPPITVWRTVKRISSVNMAAETARLEARLNELDRALDEASGADGGYPYSRLRLRIARMALEGASRAMAAEAWTVADQRLNYLFRSVQGIELGLALGGVAPELKGPVAVPNLARVRPQAGGFATADGVPVFLLGRKLDHADAAELDWLRHLGLGLAVVPAGAPERLPSLFEHARTANVSIALQFDPEATARSIGAPMTPGGFTDIWASKSRAAFEQHLLSGLPGFGHEEMLLAISLADNPRFRIYTPEIHEAFIHRVADTYPDRQALNQAWHAHLASFDDITVWGHYYDDRPDPVIEDFHYPNRRAYQHDWQTFHRELANQYFYWVRSLVRQHLPNLPLTVTLPDSLFELGETRYGVDREQVAALMEITGCRAVVETDDELFAINYPRQAAFYTYMRSLQPNKPVLNLNKEIRLDEELEGRELYQYVRTVLWESLLSGVNGLAVSNEEFFRHPDALEALAVTNLDAQRLAPVITAFHEAPSEVGIVFSNSAKMIDDGAPHLESAQYAFEGASFSGYKLRYITEADIRGGVLANLEAVLLPETPSLDDDAFRILDDYVENGGVIGRVGTPIPYDPQGTSRPDVLRNTPNTVLVRGMNLPTEYLHAMDAMIDEGNLSQITRPVNNHGYPLEGVKTRFVTIQGISYLYLVNLRDEAAHCYLTGGMQTGRDLINGRDVQFPRIVAPLDPMLIRLDPAVYEIVVKAQGGE